MENESQPKAKPSVYDLQEIDLNNIELFGCSNNLPDDEPKELPRWYVMAGFIPESELPF